MRIRILLLIILSSFTLPGELSAQYQVTDNCLLAMEQTMDLQFASAKETIKLELQQNPTNYYAYYVEQVADALALVIDPSEDLYNDFEENFDRRMEILGENDEESPYYLACRSEMLLQMCIFNVLYGDKLSGVRKGYRAYKTTYQNREKYPDFVMSKKLDGFFNVAVSNMPSFVRWAASVFGVSGNAENGVNILKNYFNEVKNIQGLNIDAALFVILPYKLNKEPGKAYDFIVTLDTSLVNNKMIDYFYINTAYRSGRNELAYNTLQDFNLSEVEVQFLPYDYMKGKILLRKLDEGALSAFEYYLRYTNNENYIKETFYNIALYYLIKGNVEQFKYYKQQALDNGKAVNERDRETVYDSKLDYIPDVNLARAKLLIDGGYFDEAKTELKIFKNKSTSFLPYKLEYELLKGRIMVHDEDIINAKKTFKKVIEEGRDEDYYFACEADIRLGWIYLSTDKTKAENCFNDALDLYQSNFYEYLEEIAKIELILLEDK